MAQLTIYLDEKSVHRIEEAAEAEKTSVSKWIKMRLIHSLESDWPSGYFEKVFGSLNDEDFPEISQPSFEKDARRETF